MRQPPFLLCISFPPAWRLSFFVPHSIRDSLRSLHTAGAAELAPITSGLKQSSPLFRSVLAVIGKKRHLLYCYGYFRSTAGAQRDFPPGLMTWLCSVIYGSLLYHAPASKDAIHPCMAVYCCFDDSGELFLFIQRRVSSSAPQNDRHYFFLKGMLDIYSCFFLILSFVWQQKFYRFVREHLCAKYPLTNP
jgi:hypothetical protein